MGERKRKVQRHTDLPAGIKAQLQPILCLCLHCHVNLAVIFPDPLPIGTCVCPECTLHGDQEQVDELFDVIAVIEQADPDRSAWLLERADAYYRAGCGPHCRQCEACSHPGGGVCSCPNSEEFHAWRRCPIDGNAEYDFTKHEWVSAE